MAQTPPEIVFHVLKSRSIGSILTSASEHMGPIEWVAPEVLAGAVHSSRSLLATTASDVYMLGGLMYEVLTGRHPYYWVQDRMVLRDRRITDTALTTRCVCVFCSGGYWQCWW